MFKADKLITSTNQNSTQNTEYLYELSTCMNFLTIMLKHIIRIYVNLECNRTYMNRKIYNTIF